jgi:hypothetical protein
MEWEQTSPRGNIISRLQEVRRRDQLVRAASGALISATWMLGIVVLILLVEMILHGSPAIRTALFWAALFAIALVTAWRVLFPLARRWGILPDDGDEETARRVGSAFPEIRDRLVNLLQLSADRAQAKGHYSPELIDAAVVEVARQVQPYDFTTIIDRKPLARLLRILAGAVVSAAVVLLVLPGDPGSAAFRLWHHTQLFSEPPPFTLTVEPGNTSIVRGQDVEIIVRVAGQVPETISLRTRPEGQVAFDQHPLRRETDSVFRTTLTAVRSTTLYGVIAGEVESPEYTLSVLDRPAVKNLRVRVTFPSYTSLPAQELEDNVGDVTALKGSVIRWTITLSKGIGRGALVFGDGSRIPLQLNGITATGSTRLLAEKSYRLELSDTSGVESTDPILYTLRPVLDAYPSVRILVPGVHLSVAGNEQLAMMIGVTDDYGFSALRLKHRLVHSRYAPPEETFTAIPLPLPDRSVREGLIPWTWDLGPLSLTPEDVVEYVVEVLDNDEVSGPKSATSEVFTLRLPSTEEVFADLDRQHDESITALEESFRQAEETRKELEDLNRDLKQRQDKVRWEDEKRAEEIARRYEDIRKNLDQVQRSVEQMMTEMQKNQVVSRETLEKYQELQQLMEQMNSPEFAEAMKRLQQALQQVNPDALKNAMQNFQFSEEAFRKSIERTLQLLKRIQIEQKVDELVRRAEAMKSAQEDLARQTEEAGKQGAANHEDLRRQQESLRKDLDRLSQELRELEKKMEEFPAEMPLEQLQDAADSLAQSGLEQELDAAQQELRNQRPERALRNQRQAAAMMQQFARQMQQLQREMQSNQQRQVMDGMRQARQDLLELSQRQEAMKNESRGLEPNSQSFRPLAQQQMDLLRDLANVTSALSNLSQKTFSIGPEMGKSIGDAMREMSNAAQSLDQRNGSLAGQQQGAAMAALNETAQQLQSALNAMNQGGQGVGMAGFLQRLQRLSGMQQGINDGTRNLSEQQLAEMARLAGEQAMARKSLEQLAREAANAGQLSKLLGDLNRVAQDMREVQTDLAQGTVNPETLRKQDRILSRLLDSQRSMRERDFEKTRKAETGRTTTRATPPPLDLSSQEGKNRLRQELLKALEEGYARDYEDLIKKYFEALEQQ